MMDSRLWKWLARGRVLPGTESFPVSLPAIYPFNISLPLSRILFPLVHHCYESFHPQQLAQKAFVRLQI